MASIWPKSPPKLVASALSGHSAIGLALGALIYILCVSGTLAVFYNEFERWEQPGAPEFSQVAPEAVERAAANALPLVEAKPHHFFIAQPTPDMPRMLISTDKTSLVANADGGIVGPQRDAWTHFLLNLHIYFHLPAVLGLVAVGIVGAMLVGLILSGLLAHPRIFRDAFSLRLGGAKRLAEADLHNRLSVWGAPFHLVIALTGAMIGLANVLALGVAWLAYDGDAARVLAPIFGPDQMVEAASPAPLADISTAIVNLRTAHPEVAPAYVTMHDPATNAQTLQIQAIHPRRLVYAELYNFTAAGELTGHVGLSDGPVGQQVFASTYPLHFGSFGGPLVRVVYGVLGLALCAVTATGLNIWLAKRREKGRPAPRLERAWIGVVWGTPAALAVSLVAGVAGLGDAVLVGLFWSVLAALIVVCVATRANRALSRGLRVATGAGILAALAIHGAREGADVLSPAGLGVTVSLAAVAAAFIASTARTTRRRPAPAPVAAE